jgi:hypothetical protein
MGKADFSDEFKRDAVAQITELGYPVAEVLSGSVSASTRFMLGSGSWPGKCLAMPLQPRSARSEFSR